MFQKITLKPFSQKEKESSFFINTFFEKGIVIDFLVFTENLQPNSGNFYKFGTTDKENFFYWFFEGKALVKGRSKAMEVYKALILYCNEYNFEYPFIIKVVK